MSNEVVSVQQRESSGVKSCAKQDNGNLFLSNICGYVTAKERIVLWRWADRTMCVNWGLSSTFHITYVCCILNGYAGNCGSYSSESISKLRRCDTYEMICHNSIRCYELLTRVCSWSILSSQESNMVHDDDSLRGMTKSPLWRFFILQGIEWGIVITSMREGQNGTGVDPVWFLSLHSQMLFNMYSLLSLSLIWWLLQS